MFHRMSISQFIHPLPYYLAFTLSPVGLVSISSTLINILIYTFFFCIGAVISVGQTPKSETAGSKVFI